LDFVLVIWNFFDLGPLWQILYYVIWANFGLPYPVNLNKFRFTSMSYRTVKIHEGLKSKNFKLKWRNPKRKFFRRKTKNNIYYWDKGLLTQSKIYFQLLKINYFLFFLIEVVHSRERHIKTHSIEKQKVHQLKLEAENEEKVIYNLTHIIS